jgi:hypothetical protein
LRKKGGYGDLALMMVVTDQAPADGFVLAVFSRLLKVLSPELADYGYSKNERPNSFGK